MARSIEVMVNGVASEDDDLPVYTAGCIFSVMTGFLLEARDRAEMAFFIQFGYLNCDCSSLLGQCYES